jgi:hypothetical protein
MRAKAKNARRLVLYVGLLCLEVGLVLAFYVFPQFEARNAPRGHWGMETPFKNAPTVLWVGLIAFSALFLLANIGLVAAIWRGLRDLKAEDG